MKESHDIGLKWTPTGDTTWIVEHLPFTGGLGSR